MGRRGRDGMGIELELGVPGALVAWGRIVSLVPAVH